MVTNTVTFDNTGSHTWTVPDGVSVITIECWGAEGGANQNDAEQGGNGGYAKGDMPVQPGTSLQINVGEQGDSGGGNDDGDTIDGGWPNGGNATYRNESTISRYGGDAGGGAGGGSSDVRYGGSSIPDIVILAGGGGGAGHALATQSAESDGPQDYGSGGSGGGNASSGEDASYSHSFYGDSHADGGTGGGSGQFDGGNGSHSLDSDNYDYANIASAGGGGGGLNGGEGGDVDGSDTAGGGGGGDGYIDNSLLSNTSSSRGSNSGDGEVVITYEIPDPAVKVWNGDFWQLQSLTTYDGTSFNEDNVLKYYDGGSWNEIHY